MKAIEVKNLGKDYPLLKRSKGKEKAIKERNQTNSQSTIFSIGNKSFIRAVDDISFCVAEGEILGFIGSNGAGKSTAIKILSSILTPTRGYISILGYDPMKERKKVAFQIGTIFGQKSQLWMHLPPLETFYLLGEIYEIDKKTVKNRIEQFSQSFDLQEIINTSTRKLSLGQRIKCEIVASLLHNPKILFLDEPTIGLDIIAKKNIRDLIIKMNQNQKTTIILTSHDVSDIEKLCDRVIIINKGKIVFENSMNHLKYNYLGKKVISLKTENVINLDINGVTLVKKKDYSAQIEVDTNFFPIKQVIDDILQKNNIIDIIIDNIPLEEIITDIYKNAGNQNANS